MRYTDATIYSMKDMCNRADIVEEIVRLLKEDGFEVITKTYYNYDLDINWRDLYITWRRLSQDRIELD